MKSGTTIGEQLVPLPSGRGGGWDTPRMEARRSVVQGPVGPATTTATQTHIPSIAGVYVEATGKTLSLSEASREHLLQPDLTRALLEAQAATGGIVDPVRKQLVSVAEALGTGLAGLEMKESLLCAERAVTGFPDPYSQEKISLYQALQKELVRREQGLRLLEAQIATGGILEPGTGHHLPLPEACAQGYLDEDLGNILSDPENEEAKGLLDPNSHQKVSYAELMRRCITSPGTGLLLLPLKISFPGLRGAVCSQELLDAGILDPATFKALRAGELTTQEVAEADAVWQYLSGTNSITGVAILQTGESRSLYQAMSEHILMPGTAEILLQAQAATGGLIDPTRSQSFTAEEAVRVGLVGPELYEKLSLAEKAVTGYKDPYTGKTLSLFQAMGKGLVPRDPGLFLLEAQLATGGIVDPHSHHRLPVEVACQRGHLDKGTHRLLCNPTADTRGFSEPNSQQNLSYKELLLRCVADPDTGLSLLPLSAEPGKEHPFIGQRTQHVLKSTKVPKPCGQLKGQPVSLWSLLFSNYVTREQRRALTQQFSSGSLSTQELADRVTHLVQQGSANSRVTFEGLRDKVTPAQLLSSDIISKDVFEKLTHGETLAQEVLGVGTVKRYLEGTGSIAGLLLPDSQEKISIYRAKRQGLLRPGTSLILLEAQAATGYIIDPAANKRYTVDEALRANVIGPEVYDKLLAAEKAVTGYKDPYTGSKISLFQAMKKDLIVKEHAIRLLEAQIATGGIIDPVNSHRLPVEAAYKRGYFDRKMNLILSDPSDDTKGFFDPNTHENLSYLQLKEKCLTEPSTGLCLLPLNSRKRLLLIDAATREAFRSSWLSVKYGRFQGQRVSVWTLLNSEYFSEGKRREILNRYSLRTITLQEIRLLLEEEMKKWARITFPAIRGCVTAYHLMETGIINRDLFEKLLEGAVSPEEVLRLDSVRKYLCGTGSIGGIVLQPSRQRVSLYEAMKRNIVGPGVALPLLEAQAATGFLIDPVNNQKLGVEEAVRGGVVGPDVYEKLRWAEAAVTGYPDPFTGKTVSLFQALKKGLVPDQQALPLLEAQLSTGGVMDPLSGHYVPVEFAQKKGYLDEATHTALSNPSKDTKAFRAPGQEEKVTYGQLIHQCEKDEATGFHLLPLLEAAPPTYTDEQVEQCFRETLLEDRGTSLWDLLSSGYFTEEQRRELREKFQSRSISLQQLVSYVQGLVKDFEMKAQTKVTLRGLRGEVPAVWLLDTGIISEETFADLAEGRRTAREVSEMASVKKYLHGTGSIAGVFLQDSKEKMSLYQAMQKGFLLPGTGERLLEAQAATGSIIDPATNQRVGVEEAIKAGLVGEELTGQLLQAEKALTGYPDPCSGKPISVCQAIRKELVPGHVGIPWLEAQLATGGVVDPVHHHHLPLQAAYQHGFYDRDMHEALSQPSEETCVFLDPNTQESLTYQQLKDRCFQDPATGLLLLPLSKDAAFYGDQHTMEAMKSVAVCVSVGRFKGQEVSLWDLLNSEYVTKAQRRELLLTYQAKKAEALQEMMAALTQIMEETEQQGRRFAFKGLRKQVSATDLFQSQLIDKGTLDDLQQGKKTVQDVTQMESVRQYLEGSNFIAGVLLQPNCERMSIYQAMRQGLLRPGAALVLLEAQAATGFLLDPVGNKRLSVDEAVAVGLVGREVYEKLLSAEKAVTGYTHPYTKRKISLFEAMKEDLIVKSHGVRLLEAQVATGGIIDPVHSHRIPVEVAYKRGYFDEELNQTLVDPSDDTKGFFDPNTHENLTYLQLLERCVQDPETGLYMLQIVRRGGRYFYIDEATKQFLKAQPMQMHVGRYRGQAVSMWDLLCSPYIQEQERKDLVSKYKGGGLTLEQLGRAICTAVEQTEQQAQAFQLKGPRGQVSAADLFNAEIIDKKTLDGLHRGPGALQQLAQEASVRRFLEGTGCIAGVLAEGQKMTVSGAMERGLLSPEHGLMLLEAQAATGFLTDPTAKKTFSVDQAVSSRLVDEDVQAKLRLAEKAVTGYTDPTTGEKVSLYQAMKRNIIEKELALRLLEAQMANGGIMDPFYGHRIPVEVAYKRGHLDDSTFLWLSDADSSYKGFVDPNTRERITYAQLLERCIKDADSGMYLLPLLDKSEYFYVDEVTKNILSSTKINVTHGKFRGQTVSLWELLSSDYINEEKRKELIQKYKQGPSAVLQHIVNEVLNMVKEKEQTQREVWFQGLRKQVTAAELLKAEIISRDTMEDLKEGKQTPQHIAMMDSVRRYLEGTGCIAGVVVPTRANPTKTEKMTIYQAMWKGILRPGTALVLLEAQAATGFMIDPLKNSKLSVREAISAGVAGGEIRNKLRAAEKAVTGYTDPYNGENISLFQAMKKGLILKEHGIRLLEAQVATGGVIDPVHSHRLPVEVAYRRGFFDEEMNRTLSDPDDDTKGFFDPNTHENLTYKQLLSRCLPDPETGLLMLHVMDRGSSSILLNEQTRAALQSARVRVEVGLFQGQGVSVWDLLLSRYIPPQRREALLQQYKTGVLTLEGLTQILTATVLEAEESRPQPSGPQGAPNPQGAPPPTGELGQVHQEEEEAWQEALRATTLTMPTGEHQGRPVLVWELLFSDYITEEKRRELLDLYRRGLLPMDRLVMVLTTLVQKKEATARKLEVKVKGPGSEEVACGERGPAVSSPDKGSWESPLRAQRIHVSLSEFQGQDLSVWDLLFSQRFSPSQREELLSRYRMGRVTLEELMDLLATLLAEGATGGGGHPTAPETGTPDNEASLGADPGEQDEEEEEEEEVEERETVPLGGKEEALKSRLVKVAAGEFHGQKVSIWDLLHSKYIPKDKRKELLQLYRSGILTTDQMETVVTTIVNRTEEEKAAREASHAEAGSWEEPLRHHTVLLPAGQLQGQEVSLWDLLFSQDVPEGQREELLRKYRLGALSLQEMVGALAPLLSEGQGRHGEGAGGGPSLSSMERPLEAALRQVPVEVPVGKFQGQRCSLWELLFSKYVSAEKRQELLEMHQTGSVSTEQLVRLVVALIEEMEAKSSQLKFSGLRRQVTASELFSAQIIDEDTLSSLTQGTKTVEEIKEMDSVKRYLEGTSCIAGVVVPTRADPARTEKMTIYQAMWKGILRPGTALVLLEAQAATGFITDPLRNRKLSVDEAVAAEVVGAELREKLLSAERAVTGYTDPYTGSSLSLFQAMKKGLIVKDHGIRLLEAQVATGGVIDPVHSHRLPVEVAYRRGFFDEEMNRTLSDPDDDTKGFFDPNTHENLTYKQLLSRCLPDPETGLLMLHVMDRGSSSILLNEQTRAALQSARVRVEVGLFQGQGVSVWDLLLSRYIPPQRREALLQQYKTGVLTLEGLTQILTATVLEAEESRPQPSGLQGAPNPQGAPPPTGELGQVHQEEEEAWQEALRATTLTMPTGEHQGRPVLVWELLFSDYITEEKRRELLDLYRRGLLPMDRLVMVLTTLVQKKEATARKLEVKVKGPGSEEVACGERGPAVSSPDEGSWESPLRAQRIHVSLPEFQGQDLSVWDLLFSQRFSPSQREELLSRYRMGRVTLEELMDLLATLLAEGATGGGGHPTAPETGTPDNEASLGADPGEQDEEEEEEEEVEERETVPLGGKEEALKSRLVKVAAGEFHGQKVSIWDLLHSKYIPKDKRKELLQLYQSGILTTDQMETVVTTIVNRTEEEKAAREASHAEAGSWEEPLRCHTVLLPAGQLQGQEVSLWDLLFSPYVSETKREELLCIFRDCHLTPVELAAILSTLISQMFNENTKRSADRIAASAEASAQEGQDFAFFKGSEKETPPTSRRVETLVSEVPRTTFSVWEFLHSQQIPDEKQMELLRLHQLGTLTPEQVKTLVTSPGSQAEGPQERPSSDTALRREAASSQSSHYDLLQHTLRQEKIDVTIREIHGERASVWDPFFSRCVSHITKEEILHRQGCPTVSVKENIRSITTLIADAESPSQAPTSTGEVPEENLTSTGTSASFQKEEHALKSKRVDTSAGGFHGQHDSLWDLLHSHYILEEKRNELLHLFQLGKLTLDQVQAEVTTTIEKTLNKEAKHPSQEDLPPGHGEETLQKHTMRFRGQEVSLWDLLFSQDISKSQQEDLLAKYRDGRVTPEELRQTLAALLIDPTTRQHQNLTTPGTSKPDVAAAAAAAAHEKEEEEELERETVPLGGKEEALKSQWVKVAAGEFHGQKVSVWDLLHSKYIPKEKRKELLQLYWSGILTTDQMATVVTTIVNRTEEEEAAKASELSYVESPTKEGGSSGNCQPSCPPRSISLEETLRSEIITVPVGDLQGQKVSCWELLSSKSIPEEKKQELLSQFKAQVLSPQDLALRLSNLLPEAGRQARGHPVSGGGDGCWAKESRGEASEDSRAQQLQLKQSLRTTLVPVAVGEYKGQEVCVLDLLFSKYVPQDKRQELLELYRAGTLPVRTMVTTLTTLIEEAERKGGKSGKKKKMSCMKGTLCWKDRGDHP
ncbi:hypothetical protein JRQ81_011053 [Phrynocephalus forsythii]|uniref:Epiplakin n=1 Tax=Phrynocephalus forsythii TaxID=171643 RepID=A0A9Q1B5N7_9SAUR|nr:hypothetical protein JRQ81_011053 [Phrynocephalus forsythii]